MMSAPALPLGAGWRRVRMRQGLLCRRGGRSEGGAALFAPLLHSAPPATQLMSRGLGLRDLAGVI